MTMKNIMTKRINNLLVFTKHLYFNWFVFVIASYSLLFSNTTLFVDIINLISFIITGYYLYRYHIKKDMNRWGVTIHE